MKHLYQLLFLCFTVIWSCTQPVEDVEKITLENETLIEVYRPEKTYSRGVPIMYTATSTITDTTFINDFIKRKDIHDLYSGKGSSALNVDSLVLGLNKRDSKAYVLFNRTSSTHALFRARIVDISSKKFTIQYNDSTKRLSTPGYAKTRCFALTRDLQALKYNCATTQSPLMANYECRYVPRFPVVVRNSDIYISILNFMLTTKEANNGSCVSTVSPNWAFYDPNVRHALQANDTLVVHTFDRKLILQQNYRWPVEL
jgi:hypothetical protein